MHAIPLPPEVFTVIRQSRPTLRQLRRARHRDAWSPAERRLEVAATSRLRQPGRRVATAGAAS